MNLKRLLPAILVIASLSLTAHAQSNQPGLVIGGQEVSGAHIHDARMYVRADAFAAAIGATVTKDEATGAVTISTGNAVPTLAELEKLNPKLALYENLSPYIPSMGIHRGVKGPHITLGVSKEGTLNTVELIVPAQLGWQPWFDEPKDQPIELEGMGLVYTQHIYLTDPQGLLPQSDGVAVLLNGRYLSTPYTIKAHQHEDGLYLPIRPAVELLGGEISWDDATQTASATVKTDGITYTWLKKMNPRITAYQPLSPFVPGMGFHYGAPGPHLTVLTDTSDRVVGFELIVPATDGWAPWFDEPKDQPVELPGLGSVYTQHLYLTPPDSIK